MTARFKLIAAAVGFALAATSVGTAAAKTNIKPTGKGAAPVVAAKTSRMVAHAPHPLHVGTRVVKRIRIVHRAPTVKSGEVPGTKAIVAKKVVAKKVVVRKAIPAKLFVKKTLVKRTFATRKIAHAALKRPLPQKQAMLHRASVKRSIVR